MKMLDILDCHKTPEIEKRLPEHIDRLLASKEKLKIIRENGLRKILSFAKKNSPWYQKSLAHIDVEKMTEERLQDLPILTKEIVMDNWDEIITDKRLSLQKIEAHMDKIEANPNLFYLDQSFHILATSGSSGTRGIFVYTNQEWLERYLSGKRHSLFIRKKNGTIPNAKKIKSAQIIMQNPMHGSYAFAKTFQDDSIERHFFPMNMPIDEVITALNKLQPDILIALPSSLFYLCREAEKGTLRIQPHRILATGETLYSPIRALIKKTWPAIKVFNYYGASEGVAAFNCRADSTEMHLNSDTCIVEPCDEKNAPVALGELSQKILVTNLYHYTQPLIRYEIADQIRFLDKTCECGLAHSLIAEPEGRSEFDFLYPNNIFVHHVVFFAPLLIEKAVREYQVTQTLSGADITIVSSGEIYTSRIKEIIIHKLKDCGLKDPEVTITTVPSLTYPASSKLRRFIPLNKSP